MKETSEVTACVVDTGLFMNMARRLGWGFKRVLYWNPDTRSFPSLRQASIGDGFEEFEHVREPWSHFNDIDLWVFPDVGMRDLQVHLANLGKPVWGAKMGMDLEQRREWFLKVLEEVGLDVPDYQVCEGIDELAEWLDDKKDQYVKISRFRGDMETHHWRNRVQDCAWLESLRMSLGPMGPLLRFLVFPSIDTDLEIGGDTYCVDGHWPELMLNGVEGKDKCYLSAVTRREEMPEQVQAVMEAFAPILHRFQYRQQWSSEIRVKDDKAYFIDATTRGGMPSSSSQYLLWENFPDIVWLGANGILCQPKPAAQFSIETMITAKREEGTWESVEIPEELEGSALFNTCCKVGETYCFPPSEFGSSDLGWLISIGDSPKQVLQDQKDMADLLPDGLNADVEAMTSIIQEIESAKEEGIPFTEQEMPEAQDVL